MYEELVVARAGVDRVRSRRRLGGAAAAGPFEPGGSVCAAIGSAEKQTQLGFRKPKHTVRVT